MIFATALFAVGIAFTLHALACIRGGMGDRGARHNEIAINVLALVFVAIALWVASSAGLQ